MFKFFMNSDFGKSKEQIQKEREKLKNKIFPFGDPHQDKIRAILGQIDSRKLNQIDLMLSFIEGKEQYLEDQSIDAIVHLIKKKPARFNLEQTKNIIALIILDAKAIEIDQLPTLTEVQDFAATLEM